LETLAGNAIRSLPHSCTSRPAVRGMKPLRNTACADPIVGWPV